MKIYKLLPAIIRTRDLLASEISGDSPVLERLLEAFEEVYDIVVGDIEGLPELLSDFGPTYSLYLALFLGSLLDTTKGQVERERLVKSLVSTYKIKGTSLSWRKAWALVSISAPNIIELYKSQINETGDYSSVEDPSHLIPSARISFYGACDTICETGAETQELSREEQEELFELIDHVRPIHVLLPQEVVTGEVTDPFADVLDTLGCSTSCETGEESWSGSNVIASFESAFPGISEDSLEIKLSCITYCQQSCTSCCETSCEQSYCQLKCEQDCETNCTVSCEEFCQACCQQNCQQSCELHCQDACQGFCEFGCENACQAHECESGTCQAGCTAVGQMLGTGPCQTQGCELYSCTQGTCMLLACTLTSCTMSAQEEEEPPFCLLNTCQGLCEFACIFGCTGEACEAAACEAGVAQGLTYTTTGEFCNRCPPTQEAQPNITTTCGMACTNAFEIHKTNFPGYGCTTAGCQGGSGQVTTTPSDDNCSFFCQTLTELIGS